MSLRLSALCLCALSAACTNSPEFEAAKRLTDPPAQAQALLANTTVKTYSRSHGTQIEYLAADGRSFLVYPGNGSVLPGQWQIRGSGPIKAEMCFIYGANSSNPVTGSRGGAWDCGFLTDYLVFRDQIVDGDPLGLQKMTALPSPLPARTDLSIQAVQSSWGLTGPIGPNKALRTE